ncbi:MAG: four helix bundle protein [Muribaculaceae bacterium]|nr:four helix bundle protein [Muribaculaceae bacterium]MBQ7853718.1 four helix bundle protein [Muribaculaceae bacterium]MBR3829823.1 four helix bundle protein [Muribaculaceae bacterium]
MKENIIETKSFAFAIRIINLYKFLCETKHEHILSKQILRCGTSIGANVKEAERGQSRADFGAKMSIALKEANETEYWLQLLFATNYISQEQAQSIISDCEELIKLLVSITKTTYNK